jgi:signal transduction histidine kinase
MGLRGRLVVALVATSVATLGAAALVVLPLLEQRLEADRLAELRGLARTIRPDLLTVPPHSPALLRIAEGLQRQTGGRITVYDRAGHVLADTALRSGPPPVGPLAAVRERAEGTRSGVVSGERGDRAFAVAAGDRVTLVVTKRLTDTRAAARVVRAALAPALLAGLAVALALAFLLARSLLKRLERLQDDAAALGTEGLRHEVTVGGSDEVAVVARALEDMRVRLVAEEASRQAFVSTASHELRTPLASLQATLELLGEEAESPRAAGRAETALRQTHRLVGLATDLLDLSRVDGDAPLAPEPLELGDHVRAVARELAARLESDGRSLEVRGGPAVAVADPAAAARIARVLLDNACRYGAGAVTAEVSSDGRRALLVVADEGPGLAPGEDERVFVRFTRGSAGARSPGAGLGLSIARGLAHAMGGELTGHGARFELALPAWDGQRQDPTPRSAALKA